jgi:hypothetical protein
MSLTQAINDFCRNFNEVSQTHGIEKLSFYEEGTNRVGFFVMNRKLEKGIAVYLYCESLFLPPQDQIDMMKSIEKHADFMLDLLETPGIGSDVS